MLEVPIYEEEGNLPAEIAGLQLARVQMIDLFDPGAGWMMRYESRFSDRDWAGANVYLYDRDELVRGGTRSERAESEYGRSATSFLNMAESERYGDLKVVRSGYAVGLVARRASPLQRLRGAGSQPEQSEQPTRAEIANDPLEDPGWWWSTFSYRDSGDDLVTHLTLRVDATLFQKVLYTYPAAFGGGDEAMAEFVKGWRQRMIDFINAPLR